jgi:signal transduction histidine kinase
VVELRAFRDQDNVVIEIADEGEGIRPADLGRIFDKFYRGERLGLQSPGIGLGLSICRGYIEAMGGHISARNRSGAPGPVPGGPVPCGLVPGGVRGAVFTITLPVPAMEDLPDLDA